MRFGNGTWAWYTRQCRDGRCGAGNDKPLDEEASFNPLSAYAVSKVETERDLRPLADKNFSPVDQAMTRDYAIARIELLVETEIAGAMLNQLIEFLKRAFVEQKLDSLTRCHLAGGVLFFDTRSTAACFGLLLALTQLIEFGKFSGFLL